MPFPSLRRTFDESKNSILAVPDEFALKVIVETKPAEVTIPPGIPPLKEIVPPTLE